MERGSDTSTKEASAVRTYSLVFLALAIITALEIGLLQPALGLSKPVRTPWLILFSFTKASLVAAFYMHLRTDNRLYLYIFSLPVILLSLFAFLAVIS